MESECVQKGKDSFLRSGWEKVEEALVEEGSPQHCIVQIAMG